LNLDWISWSSQQLVYTWHIALACPLEMQKSK